MESPLSDHSGNNTGYFLSLSSTVSSSPATLKSRVFLPTDTNHVCQIKFYYWIGHISGKLMVELQKHGDGSYENIWQESGRQQNQWRTNIITINSTDKFKVIIQGIFETQGQAETIAVDDISFSEGCFPEFGLDHSNYF
ncbi:hypothetical protein Y1Q_0014382 [Alligator mississippiensis]|uniref:MAM domain-containing protein n=1 Tax=Alligator mississippiensis TaxID=8496 RepID=A0A151PCQ9_ALLMI|nr:hypothetical protein Y1Q_0014382 [Alligator mississippiensis]